MSASSSSDKVVLSVSLSGTGQTIELINANLLEAVDVDAIVYTEVSSSVELSGTEVLSMGGEQVEKQIKSFITNNGPLDSTDKIAIVDGGNLKAKHIIFAAGPMWKGGKKNERQIMEEIVNTCLEESNKKQFNSIAFDAMCTDLFLFPTERSAEAIVNAIFNWCHFRSFSYCNTIKIFIHEPEKMKVFSQCLNLAFQAYSNIGKEPAEEGDESSKKRKNEDEINVTPTEANDQENSDDGSDSEDGSISRETKRVKGTKTFHRNAAWKRGRHENTILAKAKKNNIHDKSTNMMSLVGDTMSISTSIAMDDFTNMNDDDNADDSSNFDMTFL